MELLEKLWKEYQKNLQKVTAQSSRFIAVTTTE